MSSGRSILWVVDTVGSEPLDTKGRDKDYLHDPADWVRRAFAKALALGMDLLIAQPGGHDSKAYAVNADTYRAGLFEHDEANEEFVNQRTSAPWRDSGLRAGLYCGKLLTDTVILDPANRTTQEWMSGTLLPFLGMGGIFGGDAMMMNPAAAKRMHDACACFGVRFYQEGLPYGKFTKALPSVGTINQHLVMDPTFATPAPRGVEFRLRMDYGFKLASGEVYTLDRAVRDSKTLKSQGYALDIGSNPSVEAPSSLVAAIKE